MSYTGIYIYIYIIIYNYIYIASITQPYPTAFLALSPSNPGNAEALCVKVGFWPLGNAGLFVGTSSPETGEVTPRLMAETPESLASNSGIVMSLIWLMVEPPLWKIWKSVGIMTFPIYGQIKNVPNHQPVILFGVNLWVVVSWKNKLAKNQLLELQTVRVKWTVPTTSKYQKVHAGWGPPVLSWFINHYNPH